MIPSSFCVEKNKNKNEHELCAGGLLIQNRLDRIFS